MKTFDIYQHQIYGYEAVRQTQNSWAGFFFSWGWGFYHKLWKKSIPFFILWIVVVLVTAYSKFVLAGVLRLIVFLWVGWKFSKFGAEWRVEDLVKRGYLFVARTEANTEHDAILMASKNKRQVEKEEI